MYGTQVSAPPVLLSVLFENDVKMYGTQAPQFPVAEDAHLRMM